jgi:hypothetical protein
MIGCDINDCKNEAIRTFCDGSKPNTWDVCEYHLDKMVNDFRKFDLVFRVVELDRFIKTPRMKS